MLTDWIPKVEPLSVKIIYNNGPTPFYRTKIITEFDGWFRYCFEVLQSITEFG